MGKISNHGCMGYSFIMSFQLWSVIHAKARWRPPVKTRKILAAT
jgi:hypothetical protein